MKLTFCVTPSDMFDSNTGKKVDLQGNLLTKTYSDINLNLAFFKLIYQ